MKRSRGRPLRRQTTRFVYFVELHVKLYTIHIHKEQGSWQITTKNYKYSCHLVLIITAKSYRLVLTSDREPHIGNVTTVW
jgi:hypothetical protein